MSTARVSCENCSHRQVCRYKKTHPDYFPYRNPGQVKDTENVTASLGTIDIIVARMCAYFNYDENLA